MKAKQEKFIELKILQPQLTQGEIAKACGVTARTIENWEKDEEVKQELKKRTDECWGNLIYKAQLRMAELVDDTNTSVALGASKYILDSLGRNATDKLDLTTKGKVLTIMKASDADK